MVADSNNFILSPNILLQKNDKRNNEYAPIATLKDVKFFLDFKKDQK